jgi:hypothetical protein
VNASPIPGADATAELRGPDGPLTMVDIAGVIGAFRDVEMALFSWLGRAAGSLKAADDVVWASSASLRAAWRAAQLEQLLPVSAGLPDAEPATASPGTAVAAALEALRALVPPALPEAAGRLASAWYAALLDAYGSRLDRLAPAADGALERVLRRLVTDLAIESAGVRGSPATLGRDA